MMIIDIRKLNAQKSYSGSMEFEYSAPETLIEIPFVKFAAPVNIKFDYELYEDNSIELRGTVSYKLEGQCSRCLEKASALVEGELDAYFEPRKGGEDYSYSNGIVDLTKAVDDAIMASMPFLITCGEDCKGLAYSDKPTE
ncbi:MAG: DUF177 domain-containing protein [Clostridia bacterium]|nr:DUF177 domain-containing protein [Clostridia bacterium]